MNSSTTFCDPYLSDDELNKFRKCILLRKSFMLLASRKQPSLYRRKQNRQKNCLQWLRQWVKLDNDDPSSLVDLLYVVITQYIFPKMPKEYLSESCKFHHYNHNCHCTVGNREHFVLKELNELGIDVNQLRSYIDAAFIMTLENNSPNMSWDGRPIDQTPRRGVSLIRNKKASNVQLVPQLTLRVGNNSRPQLVSFSETRDRVIVEYLPKTTQNLMSILKPRLNNGDIRRLNEEPFEENA